MMDLNKTIKFHHISSHLMSDRKLGPGLVSLSCAVDHGQDHSVFSQQKEAHDIKDS